MPLVGPAGFRRGRRRGLVVGAAVGAAAANRSNKNANNQQADDAPQATQNNSMAELEKLAELKDKGILTQEEFDAKKKQILGL